MTGPEDDGDPARFEASWLELREPVDRRARDRGARALFSTIGRLTSRTVVPAVWDLGAGTGANVRALAPYLPSGTAISLVEPDPRLSRRGVVPGHVSHRARWVAGDLRRPAETLAALEPEPTLVTASALFDLGDRSFAEGVLDAVSPPAWLLALEVDGRLHLEPDDPEDETVLAAFGADQRRPKGLGAGPALGPDAPAFLRQALVDRGYEVASADTAWRLDAERPADRALLRALIVGLASVPGAPADAASGWLTRRQQQVDGGSLRALVGHRDLLGIRADG